MRAPAMRAAASAAARRAAAGAGRGTKRGAARGAPRAAPRFPGRRWLPLYLRPGLGPLGVVLADRAPIVTAVGHRSRPVPDLLEVLLVVGVEGLAVVLVHGEAARRLAGRGLAEVLGRLRVRLRRDDVIHPEVHAIRMLGLGRDHPGVRPPGRALLGQRRGDGGLLTGKDVGLVLPRRPDHGAAA